MNLKNTYGDYGSLLEATRARGVTGRKYATGLGRIEELGVAMELHAKKTEERLKLLAQIASFGESVGKNLRRYDYMKTGAELIGEPLQEKTGFGGFLSKVGTALFGPKLKEDVGISQSGLELLGAAKKSAPMFLPDIQKMVEQYYKTEPIK